ncbi:hypothetical protein F5Y02DRAFT_405874 [Annulohypoxylon stygium]|nr:hypothetical protein F5Y02DRAFT_405874 [Annulohypoxylon stygium]
MNLWYQLFVAAPLLWAISTSLVKLSILFFYISIFTIPRIRIAVFIVIALTVALIIAVIFESFLLCRPFEFTWNKEIPGGVCGNSTDAYLAIGIVNLIIDFSLVLLPMPVLWRLQMPVGKKIAISAILGLGLLICGLSAARIKSVLSLDPLDFTYSVVTDLIFGALEIELGIVNACLPILRPLVRKVFQSESTFFKGWSKKTNSIASKTYKSSTSNSNRKFRYLPDDIYPLREVVSGEPSDGMVIQARTQPLYNMENGERSCSGRAIF